MCLEETCWQPALLAGTRCIATQHVPCCQACVCYILLNALTMASFLQVQHHHRWVAAFPRRGALCPPAHQQESSPEGSIFSPTGCKRRVLAAAATLTCLATPAHRPRPQTPSAT